MITFSITDQNFDKTKSRSQTTVAGITTAIAADGTQIIVSVNSLAPFAIYKWAKDGHFCISNKLAKISEYIAQFGEELQYERTLSPYFEKKTYVDHIRNCKSVSRITNWKRVSIKQDGSIAVIKNDVPFTVPLVSQEGVDVFLEWVEKYLRIVHSAIAEQNFIPDLTGGLDTRILSWFWRDEVDKLSYYHLCLVKPDGKDNVERGSAESEIAAKVLEKIGASLERVEKVENKVGFKGIFTENARHYASLNDPNFLYDFVGLHMSDKGIFYSMNSVCPFVDNLYLSLFHPAIYYMRTLLALLFCPDLLSIELYGFSDKPSYFLESKFSYLIPDINKFIDEYDLHNKVAEVKRKVLYDKR